MEKPSRPENLNGEHGAMWHMLEYTNHNMDLVEERTAQRMDSLDKRITQLFFTIILGLAGVAGALIATG